MKRFPYREIVFGLEDSIVSTLGVVVGIAAGTDSRYLVVLSTIVVVVVESLSMTAGTYLSNKSQIELDLASGKLGFPNRRHLTSESISDSLFMGISYLLGGVISVLPFLFFPPLSAIIPAVLLSVVVLFSIGYIKGKSDGKTEAQAEALKAAAEAANPFKQAGANPLENVTTNPLENIKFNPFK